MSSSSCQSPKLSPERVRDIAKRSGYEEIILAAKQQGYMMSFKHGSKPGCGGPNQEYGPVRIDVYFTTGKVTTSLHHPTRGRGQLQRDFEPDYNLLEEIFVNPRYHSGTGYRTREVGAGREGRGSEIFQLDIHQEKRRREERGQEADETDEDIPGEFYHTKWPHPRLNKNRPTGEDEALVWFLESEKEQIQKYVGRRTRNR